LAKLADHSIEGGISFKCFSGRAEIKSRFPFEIDMSF